MKKKIMLLTLILCLSVTLIFTGCDAASTPDGQDNEPVKDENEQNDQNEPEPVSLTVEDVYPLNPGDSWTLKGEGNEFAGFEQKVLYREDNRVQTQFNNGGTTLGRIYEYQDGKLKVVFNQEEMYGDENILKQENNVDQVILAEPIEVGNSWESESNIFTIDSLSEKVVVPAGEFSDCIKVTVKSENGNISYVYYKPGLGLVKQEYIGEEYKITEELQEYTVPSFKNNK
ncbi:hypothetical protein SAMN00017405_1018 [Desulfonispora thiosulfatigenes DSM 11270]|uniref:Lipoprotein n=1 Tax=Desulfonispora thiosulfatigenes DSM 11270 TaxID=656914 RepID=A0A1W1UR16_DESTI|nr:hypothetical protein [Desulfonispora thiosulfatigenes]SMB83251.1 hypothetical protein SAMN00017405_1018 [Desulfonispora thiosulfatigenes DSM 11270]